MRVIIVFALVLSAVGGPRVAGQAAGDILVTRPDGIYKITRGGATPQLIASLPGADEVIAATRNDGLIVQSGARTFQVRNGAVTTFAQFPSGATIADMMVDQTGDYVMLDTARNLLLRVQWGTAGVSTIMSVPSGCSSVTRDFETGGYVLSCGQSALAVSRSGAISTLFTTGNFVGRIEHLPHRDHFAVLGLRFKVFDRNGVEQASHDFGPNVSGMAIDWQAGEILLRPEDLDVWLEGVDLNTYARRVHHNYRTFYFENLVVFGSRRATGIGTGKAGSNYSIALRFPGSPNTNYCGAIALDNQPSISIGPGFQAIKPDALFFMSLCGGLPVFTRGFAGTTDNMGRASMDFPLPAFGAGLKLYATASAFSTGIDHANVVCVLIE